MQLKAYNDTDIETHGVCFVKVKLKNGRVFPRVKFVIVPDARGREMQQSILGVGDSERFGLVVRTKDVIKVSEVRNGKDCTLTKDRVRQEYKDIFQGLGCLEGKVNIQLKEDATPVVYPARKVPVALREKLKMELDRLVKNEVIEKTEGATDWVLPLVLVEKADGSLRICMDPLRLNQSVKREHYHLPERSEIQVGMAGAKVFSKLDASQGFYNLQLDERSTRLHVYSRDPLWEVLIQKNAIWYKLCPRDFSGKNVAIV